MASNDMRSNFLAKFVLLFLLGLISMAGSSVCAQQIDSAEIKMDEISPFGSLYATIEGKQYKVADTAIKFWVLQRGRSIVFSTPGTAEEVPDVGQGLYMTDVTHILEADRILHVATTDTEGKTAQETLKKRNLLPRGLYASSFRVDDVAGAISKSGKFALLVSLSDKAGVPRFVVLSTDAEKTSTWERSRFVAFKNGKIVVNIYPQQGKVKMGPKDKPLAVRTFDLDEILRADAP